MIYFNNDYSEGAHPKILEKLNETNFEQSLGYAEDEYCENAKKLIKKACKNEDVDIHFLVGGTQCNLTFISSALRPHQAVISADTGHINTHETGAIEATGHKVISLSSNGKLTALQIEDCILSHINDTVREHTVQPKMVYISNSSENGLVYTKTELQNISDVCKKYSLIFYLDGARLGYAMASEKSDIGFEDLCNLCDAFYIGGTKQGAMFGEALVLCKDNLKEDFRYHIKQKGGMLAKGRLLGIQFSCLFTDNLYLELGLKAVKQAYKIAETLESFDIKLSSKCETNQVFPILSKQQYETLSKDYALSLWEKMDNEKYIVRICTSWATKDENIDLLLNDIKKTL